MTSDEETHQENSYEAMLLSSFKRERRKTDVYCSYVFGFFFITFIAISSYANFAYGGLGFKMLVKSTIQFYGFTEASSSLILATFFYLLFFSVFLILLSWAPKVLVYVARINLYIYIIIIAICMVLTPMVVIGAGLDRALNDLKVENINQLLLIYVVPGLSLIILIPTTICLRKEGIQAISNILKTSCRSLACFRSPWYFIVFILFYCMATVIVILLSLFMLAVTKCYHEENLSGLLLCMCILGGVYMYSFSYHLGVAVMSNTIAFWHYNQNNKEIPLKSLWQSFELVYKFHLGTVAFVATGILPFCSAICAACRHTVERCTNPIIARIFKFVLIGEMTNFAMIQTSIHGYHFSESTKRCFDLMVKNYSISLALIKVFEFVMSIVFNLPIIFSLLLISGFGYWYREMELGFIYNYQMIMTIILIPPAFMIVGTAVKTTLLYRLEKQEFEKSTDINTSIRMTQNGDVV